MTELATPPDVGEGRIRVLHVGAESGPSFETTVEAEHDRIEVETHTDAASVLDRLATGGVDCVVAEYELPDTDGLALLERVREAHPDLPFVLFTGRGDETVASEALSAGATDYVERTGDAEAYAVLTNRVESAVERYRSERAAEYTERRLRELAEHTPDVRWIFGADWEELLFVNGRYETVYGGSVAELRTDPSSFLQTVHPEDRPAVERAMDRVTDGETVRTEYRVNPATDYGRWVEVYAEPVYEDGEVARIVGYSRDVTDRRERERGLERQATVLTALGDAVYALDEAGQFTYVNDALVELTGYDRETLLGADVSLIKDESAVAVGERHLAALLADDQRESSVFEVEIQPREGEPIPCEDRIAALPREDGSFAGSAGVLRDVSTRHERERELKETRQLLASSLDALDDVHFVLGLGGRVRRWNDALTAVTGYDDETVDGMEATAFFAAEDRERVAAAVTEVLETGDARVEADIETADGERIPYEFRATALEGEDGERTGIVGIGRDVSTRREYERSLERQNERLEEFAGVVSHDLRNPLTAIRSDLELYRATGDESHLEDLADTADRMERLLDEVLHVAKDEDDVETTEPVDLDEVVRLARNGTLPETASVECAPTPLVLADRDRLHRLVENLLRNAAEHGGDGVAVRVGPLGPWPDDRSAADVDGFFVADDGPGIPAAERERVFESGYSSDSGGTGYGLAVVRSVAETHGWTVTVTDAEGGGARFEVRGVEFIDGEAAEDGG
jgi:PAS domain S-box-containing protein